jgi:hypothetical protein
MATTRLPDPGLLPTSQEGGGTVHSNELAQTSPGSMPGFDGGTMNYPVSTDDAAPPAGPDRDDRRLVGPSGAKAQQDSPFPQAGAFAQASTEDANAAMWKKTPSSSS